MKQNFLHILLLLAGIGQIFTAVVYPLVRYKVLLWFTDLKKLTPLNEAIAKIYGYYIQGINFCMGLLSVMLPSELLRPTSLSIAVVGFMAMYWIGRISFQLKDYSFKELSKNKHFKKGVWGMNLLISFFALTYSILFLNLLIQSI
ncbi:hypothetical protein [Marinirhabdus gelatinilytica]|uniref:DUF4149 domain-containing protein n=1 Tax=Marinirhabdus gelatinilytica TaxID=1703343 RepID=A0A370Q7A3_9FLAO|nr:hypothetical protein [Marinirhabdus gelatinilytica]RDK84268.1 hypothetical protein C8D94_105113 [Marinirhabdus gelatinilytica]